MNVMAGSRNRREPGIAAGILAGGRASRFSGCAKGLLELPGGVSIIENALGAVAAAGIAPVAILANDPEPYEHLGVEIVPDRRPGLGPLGGIEAALFHYSERCEAVLVLPCDVPGITGREVRALRAAFEQSRPPAVVAATGDGFWHPLCAVARVDLLSAVSRALDAGQNGVYRLWRGVGAVPVYFDDAAPFFNVNTPADLDRWLLGERQPEREAKLV
jgi:molybdopterin-guanine dinucleotide biosynthesis protein A